MGADQLSRCPAVIALLAIGGKTRGADAEVAKDGSRHVKRIGDQTDAPLRQIIKKLLRLAQAELLAPGLSRRTVPGRNHKRLLAANRPKLPSQFNRRGSPVSKNGMDRNRQSGRAGRRFLPENPGNLLRGPWTMMTLVAFSALIAAITAFTPTTACRQSGLCSRSTHRASTSANDALLQATRARSATRSQHPESEPNFCARTLAARRDVSSSIGVAGFLFCRTLGALVLRPSKRQRSRQSLRCARP